MAQELRKVNDIESLMTYFSENLGWAIDPDDYYDIDDITYDFEAADLGLKDEAFAKITSLKQLRPLVDDQRWGVFFVNFESTRFEVSALRKILSGLVPSRRNADHAVWDKKDLLFLCTWGERNKTTIGAAYFEDAEKGLPQIKMISCEPAVEDFTQINVFEQRLSKLAWPSNTSDVVAWHEAWSSAFTTRYRQTIQDAHTLTVQLAEEAQNIRDRILSTLEIETSNGYVHLLYEKFKNTLVHDMTEQQFADMYAQTVVYGLFSARCMDNSQEDFNAQEAVECIPNTNPFLKSLLQECIGSQNSKSKLSFDELEVGNIVELLLHTNMDSIITDFNRQTGGGREDPVIHFYEEFLSEYDKTQRVQRGVYYTPQSVVNFIVRAVDDILRQDFGVTDGLASTETKKVKFLRESKKRVNGLRTTIEDEKEVPAIQILDPATGTGTFLRQAILQIYQNFCEARKGKAKSQIQAEWNEYVPKHLLPRLNGFELMMAPYAVAHMKLAMVLKDTGYQFDSNERLQVYLTNTLEKPGNSDAQLTLFDDPLAFEAVSANKVKKNNGINVVIGNPPYSGESANKGEWILDLISPYKMEPGGVVRLNERNPKWLNDDYVKFIRLSQCYISRVSNGILSFICPHGFIDNPTFRGMRWSLATTFEQIYIIDLHGNAKKKETAPDGRKDENVFDIQQGVCIMIMVHNASSMKKFADIYHADVFGLREEKYDWLNNARVSKIVWNAVKSEEPFYLFKPSKAVSLKATESFGVIDLFTESVMGFQTHRDEYAISFDKATMESRINDLLNDVDNDILSKRYNFGTQFNISKAKKRIRTMSKNEIEEKLTRCQYRLFDTRYCFLDESVMDRPRTKVYCHVLNKENYVFGVGRQGLAVGNIEWCLATVSKFAFDANIFRRGGITAAPLYLYTTVVGEEKRIPNLNENITKKIEHELGIAFVPEKQSSQDTFAPIDILDYVYAVLYSHKYRETFADSLKIDYPQIPIPQNRDYFWRMAEKGAELRVLHCMEKRIEPLNYEMRGLGNNNIEKIIFKNNCVFINKSQCFESCGGEAISQEMWDYTIGGTQPLQKWLKDRKNMELTEQDVQHYLNMLAATFRTIKLMEEIDLIIEL